MSNETIFDSTTQESQATDTTSPSTFQIPTEASEFVGSGKKYQSAEEALKSVPHAQKHIQTLEQEVQTLKEELVKRRTAEQLLDEMKSGFANEQTTQAVGIDPDKIAEIVNQSLNLKERQRSEEANVGSVVSKFTEMFADKAEEVYNNIAKEAGLSVTQLNKLAASSPKAVLKLAGLDKSVATLPSKSNGTVNTQIFNQSNQQTTSSKVPKGASTKDLVNAWKAAGETVKQKLSTT
jgi:hypothetical protein